MKPVFCGNLEYDTRPSDLERLFSKFGRVDRVDVKSVYCPLNVLYNGEACSEIISQFGQTLVTTRCYSLMSGPLKHAWQCALHDFSVFSPYKDCTSHILMLGYPCIAGYAFIYFEDERDADYAIRNLDNMPFGYERRKLSVEWSRGERGVRHREGSRSGNTRPTKTLFIVNFDPIRTRPSDIERHFEPYGKITNVRIRRNFAFVQFETQAEATNALECTNRSKILGHMITVDYALSDDGDRGDDRGGSPRRGDGGCGAGPYGWSLSPPYCRGHRFSPEYGRRSSPIYGRSRSPVYDPYDGPVCQRGRNAAYGRY